MATVSDADRHEPIRHAFNVTGERLKRLDRLIAQIRRDRDDMKSRTDVDPGRSVMNDRQSGACAHTSGHDHLLKVSTPDGDSDQITFLNGVTRWCHHSWVRSFPWARFFDGDECLQKAGGHCPGALAV